jgi:4-diphosphocytidyl-2-C-methyl-D-erythritol kinase
MSAVLEKQSPCKVNLLLNILGRRPDGFHELETVMQPIGLTDQLTIRRLGRRADVELTCNEPELPTDSRNLVHRAATAFLNAARIDEGVRIHLEKRIPMAAGLGGGSGNAGTTLLALNELFGAPLAPEQLMPIAATLGSDVPFFLQSHPQPALATGRGENVLPLVPFPALRGAALLLIHPGFGISTAWAYQELKRFPEALHGRSGRAGELIEQLQQPTSGAGRLSFYNSLEAPALEKYPLLALYQEFLRETGALATLMSGSGSTTFALAPDARRASALEEKVRAKFGPCWTAVAPIPAPPARHE